LKLQLQLLKKTVQNLLTTDPALKKVAQSLDVSNRQVEKMTALIERGSGVTWVARCAYGVLLMMETGIRVGNEASAEGYITQPHPNQKDKKPEFVKTYGLTTLEVRHAYRRSGKLFLNFVGKKAVENHISTENKVLYKYYPELVSGAAKSDRFLNITHNEIKRFVKRYVGHGFLIKDIRTARVNLYFIEALKDKQHRKAVEIATTKKEIKQALAKAVEDTAMKVGHTKGVCKKSYISDNLYESYHSHIEERRLRRKQ
jgi:DNA topoisomerase IB